MRFHDQSRVGKWGRGRIFFSLFNFFFQFFVISVFFNFFHYAKMVGNRFTEMVFFVWRPLNSLDGIIPNYVSWKGAQTVNERLFINSFFLFCFGVPVPCVPVCFESYFFTIFFTFLLVGIRMLPLHCSYVLVCDSYVTRLYSYVFVRCFSHDLYRHTDLADDNHWLTSHKTAQR